MMAGDPISFDIEIEHVAYNDVTARSFASPACGGHYNYWSLGNDGEPTDRYNAV